MYAGGAGAAASSIGKDSATELDQVETNIEQGTGLTEKPADEGGLGGLAGCTVNCPPSSDDGSTGNGATDGGATDAPTDSGAGETTADSGAGANSGTLVAAPDRPAKHEKHIVDAQLQFALLIIIILSALYIVFARIDDWFRYRR